MLELGGLEVPGQHGKWVGNGETWLSWRFVRGFGAGDVVWAGPGEEVVREDLGSDLGFNVVAGSDQRLWV